MSLSICVFCGARTGADPRFAEAARTLGRLIGGRGHRLVYGGGNVGLMGIVADAAMAAGGQVLGVIPQRLQTREVGHPGLSELRVVPDMHTRKRLMAEAADAFIALPGGIGTLEELFEVWTWRHLGYHDRPLGLLDVAGFYQPLRQFLQGVATQGFVEPETLDALLVEAEADRLLARIEQAAPLSVLPPDLTRS